MFNFISAFLALVSLSVLIITIRKLAATIQMGRELAKQVQMGTACLDQALSTLREEHQEFRDENRKMDARMIESTRVRRDIDRSISHMENVRDQLKSDFNQFRSILATQAHGPSAASGAIHTLRRQPIVPKSLPVFVQRKAHKTPLNDKIQLLKTKF
ncbi:BAB2_0123 family type IV secretion system effector [Bartonella rochalimae]|uniref:BAB2_0123 family type IV secretion system effector n=1 Tax=Bartonella rochalimae TaxID=395923 RepID=UPI003F683461